MPKKRKTRRQKERQKQPNVSSSTRKTDTRLGSERMDTDQAVPDESSREPDVEGEGSVLDTETLRRLGEMKYSLYVFGTIVGFQLVIWGLIQFEFLPSGWVEILVS